MDLLGEHLAERAAEDGEVLAEDEHLAAVDRAPAGDDAVGERSGVLDAEAVGAVAGEHVELDERAGVEQEVDALAGGELAPLVLALDRGVATRRAAPAPGGSASCSSRSSIGWTVTGAGSSTAIGGRELLLDQLDQRSERTLGVDERHRGPPAAGTGRLVDEPAALGLDPLQGGGAVVDPVPDVVDALALGGSRYFATVRVVAGSA